jgi:hypothetical protein
MQFLPRTCASSKRDRLTAAQASDKTTRQQTQIPRPTKGYFSATAAATPNLPVLAPTLAKPPFDLLCAADLV